MLANMSFDEVLDPTADAACFFIVHRKVTSRYDVSVLIGESTAEGHPCCC